ncbi:hypothetical protein Agabi119p4_10360 [Agaricus bisporus var. burnettii]|uniref:C2H2-type domain-containing protein n=1 Tax=Agaricus bisporus var. burnettii TaxID=192524 RepID=A0A8H7C246_AGABI|nr:hypothetical protein Agabi119p4_10360 [Agaricus bisporus var. burnettii]
MKRRVEEGIGLRQSGPHDKRHKPDNPSSNCDVCGKSLLDLKRRAHVGCTLQQGFISLKNTDVAYTLRRDPDDKKVPCPNCDLRAYDMHEVKKHIHECASKTPTQKEHRTPEPQGYCTSQGVPEAPALDSTERQGSSIGQAAAASLSKDDNVGYFPLVAETCYEQDANASSVARPQAEHNVESTSKIHVFQSPLLRKHGLVVNTLHRILICIACQGIINPQKIRDHFSALHKSYKTPPDLQKEFDEDLERCCAIPD